MSFRSACPHASRIYFPLLSKWNWVVTRGCNSGPSEGCNAVRHFKFLLQRDRTEEITLSWHVFPPNKELSSKAQLVIPKKHKSYCWFLSYHSFLIHYTHLYICIHILWFYPLICFYIHPFNHCNIILRVSSFETFWVILDFFSFVCYKCHKMINNFSEIYIKISYATRKKYTDA